MPTLVGILNDKEKIGNDGNDELLRERWGTRDKGTVGVNGKRQFVGVSKLFQEGCVIHDVIHKLVPCDNV